METVIGINNLKDKYREAKIRSGDMRGMTAHSRFTLAVQFGINPMQVAFDSISPKEGKIEIEASIWIGESSYGSAYSLKNLIDEINSIKDEPGEIEIQLVKLAWNKYGTDADRSNIGNSFIFKHK